VRGIEEARRDRTATAILDVAAAMLAARPAASMGEIAAGAGVGRATLYRYFPTRTALLRALGEAAFTTLCAGLDRADLAHVPVEEGLARATRTFLSAGATYIAVVREASAVTKPPSAEAKLMRPLRDLFRRGVREGALRADLGPDLLFTLYSGLLESGVRQLARARVGVEPVSGAIVALFLDGARAGR
jgi:TetR/AcrR family transcriptional repressor of mexCD-oprJ operon